MADEAGIAKLSIGTAAGAVFEAIAEVPARGKDVAITGFGWFARNDWQA